MNHTWIASETSRVGIADSSFAEIATLRVPLHHQLVLDDLHQGIGCDPFCTSSLNTPRLRDRFCLLSMSGLTFMMRQKIKKMMEPLTYAREISVRLSEKLNRPIDLGTPAYFRGLTEKLEEVLLQLIMKKEECVGLITQRSQVRILV